MLGIIRSFFVWLLWANVFAQMDVLTESQEPTYGAHIQTTSRETVLLLKITIIF